MIMTIIKWLLIAMVIALIVLWLWAGGFAQTVRFVRTIQNPLDVFVTGTSSYAIVLPWQTSIPQGPDISGFASEADARNSGTSQSPADQLSNLQDQYSSIQTQAQGLPPYGTPSPYAGEVTLAEGNATESDPALEYVEVNAASRNTAPVSISGWSLQSMVSGKRAVIGVAAAPYILGTINNVVPVTLDPGYVAIVSTAPSPLGVSFRENKCTGYLEQLQQFDPALSNSCPTSSDIMPLTAQNLSRYGNTCFDFIQGLPQCEFPTRVPTSLSASCRAYVANTFTYNGCVNMFRGDPDFSLDTWRIYLGYSAGLWNNAHDVIRLTDAEGRTVDVLTY